MGRSQRHKIEEQGFASSGALYEEGGLNDKIFARLGGPGAVFPTLASISPATAVIGGADLTMHCYGTNFTTDCKILFNHGVETTTFVSATELTTIVKPSLATVAGSYPVQVMKANLIGTSEKPFTFTLTAEEPEGAPEQGALEGGRSFPIGPVELLSIIPGDPDGVWYVIPVGTDIQPGDTVRIEATGSSALNGDFTIDEIDDTQADEVSFYRADAELAAPVEAKGRLTVIDGGAA